MTIEHFEDCRVGDQVVTPSRTITEADVVQFAALTADWNPLHTDAEYAKHGIFDERVVHGMLTMSIGTALLFRVIGHALLPKSVIAVAGLDKVRLLAPVKIEDSIHTEGEIVQLLEMPNQQGLIRIRVQIKNQRDEKVATGHLKIVAGRRREAEESSGN